VREETKAGIDATALFEVMFESYPVKPFTVRDALGLRPTPLMLVVPPLYEEIKLEIVGCEIVTVSWEVQLA